MTNLDSILKSRDITLPTKAHLVKALVFPVVMYRCTSWTIKKAESESEVAQSCPTLCDPVDCSLSGSSVHGILQARILDCVASPPGELPDLEIKSMSPGSPALQVDSLPTEPSGKPII